MAELKMFGLVYKYQKPEDLFQLLKARVEVALKSERVYKDTLKEKERVDAVRRALKNVLRDIDAIIAGLE